MNIKFNQMKTIVYICTLLLSFNIVNAQNNLGKTDDAGRIALAAVVPGNINGLNTTCQNYLKNKLNQISSKYGMGGSAMSERFIITANVLIVNKDITSTAPPMHSYTLEINFFIGDGIDGKLFASTTKTLKGVGETDTKAYKAALKNIKSSDPVFKSFMDEGKNKIIEYYNSHCDFILQDAEMLVSRNEYEQAIYELVGVPDVCKECYEKASKAVAPVYQKQIDHECIKLLAEAKNAWNESMDSKSAQKASIYLGQIDPNAKGFSVAEKLTNEIAKRMKELDQREWDFKLKEQQDKVDLRDAQINAAKEIGVAYGKNQPKDATYNYKGWWK